MSHTVVLHIGSMKSGTSFVQGALAANREALRDQGFVFPGTAWREQVMGVMDALGQKRDGAKPPKTIGAWARLLEEIRDFDGTSVISMEFLAATPVPDIKRVVSSLRPADVRVVLTARDLGRNIPAMWQEGLKNRNTWAWEEFLQGIRYGDLNTPGTARRFWRHQNVALIARKWSKVAGQQNLSLVTVPPSGGPRDLLWNRFAEAVGLDASAFTMPARDNASIGAPSALVLRELNEAMAGATGRVYNKLIKHRLAKEGMTGRRHLEPAIGYTVEPWLETRADDIAERLRKLGVPLIGDLADLEPASVPGVDPRDVPQGEVEEAAVAALRYLVGVWSASQTPMSADT